MRFRLARRQKEEFEQCRFSKRRHSARRVNPAECLLRRSIFKHAALLWQSGAAVPGVLGASLAPDRLVMTIKFIPVLLLVSVQRSIPSFATNTSAARRPVTDSFA